MLTRNRVSKQLIKRALRGLDVQRVAMRHSAVLCSMCIQSFQLQAVC